MENCEKNKGFFDGCGLKKHFYEPDDIRALVNFYNFLGRMSILTGEYSFDSYRLNVNRLMFDITDRLSDYKLNGKQRETFRDICQVNIGRQGVAFTQYVYESLSEGKFKKDFIKYGYSYGELLRGIYTFGRECGNEKNLIHCIIALETVLLTDLYQTSLNGKESEKEKLKATLLECMSGSVCGSWGNKLVPGLLGKILDEKGKNDSFSWGYVKGNFDSDYTVKYSIDNPSDDLYSCLIQMISDKDFQLVKNLELLFMFITKIQNISDESLFTFECKKETKVENFGEMRGNTDLFHPESKVCFELKLCHYRMTFDILGFVINCVQYEKCIHKIVKDEIIDAIVNDGNISLDSDQKKQIRSLIDQNSWKSGIKRWTEREKTYLPLPIYSTDIMYNVLKRVKQKNERENARIIEKKELLKTLKTTLRNIADELKKEDEFFNADSPGTKSENSCNASFESAFTSFPVVKAILEWENMHGFEALFNEVIAKFVGNVHELELDNLAGMEEKHG